MTQQWEYKWISDSAENVTDMEKELTFRSISHYGRAGWELVSVLPIIQDGTTVEVYFILKRQRQIGCT
jgi:hypothetical protein